MFRNNKQDAKRTSESTSLIAVGTRIVGNITFGGRLHIDGMVDGAVHADDAGSVLTLSEHAVITGEIVAPHIVVNGTVNGDVTAGERLELASGARVEGSVYYKLLEMSAGARINGKMVHRADAPRQLAKPEAAGDAAAKADEA